MDFEDIVSKNLSPTFPLRSETISLDCKSKTLREAKERRKSGFGFSSPKFIGLVDNQLDRSISAMIYREDTLLRFPAQLNLTVAVSASFQTAGSLYTSTNTPPIRLSHLG
jgi:hypothetical protein